MTAADHAGYLDRADDLHRLAIDDLDVVAVADVEELLCGIGGEREVARELRVGLDHLLQELPVAREALDAAVLPIGDVDDAVLRHAHGVDDAEVARTVAGRKAFWRHDLAVVIVHRLVAEGAPHPLERAR